MLEMQNGINDDWVNEETDRNTNSEQETQAKKMTPYEQLSYDLSSDPRCQKDVTLGKRIGFYQVHGYLGSGNFSHVKLGFHSLTREKVAIKILDKTKLDKKTQMLLSREMANMEKLYHPNIIRLYEVIETLARLHLVMEYASGGELYTKVSNEGKLSEPDARHIYSQILAALDHMHRQYIVHRDVKAENVFYTSAKCVKIGDLGFSTTCSPGTLLSTYCGSPPYAAPELFKDENYLGVYVDIWAMGILLYFIVTGIMPFRTDTIAKLKKCILEGSYLIPGYVSHSCQFLIRSILKAVPKDRFTIDEIKSSEWLEGQEFPADLEQYSIYPSVSGISITKEERDARKALSKLGITDEHFKRHRHRNSCMSATGTYRILMHKMHKRHMGINDSPSLSNLRDLNIAAQNEIKKVIAPARASKFCTIL